MNRGRSSIQGTVLDTKEPSPALVFLNKIDKMEQETVLDTGDGPRYKGRFSIQKNRPQGEEEHGYF